MPAAAAQWVRLVSLSEGAGNPWASMAEFNVLDAAGGTIPRVGWGVTADSQELSGENGAAINATDGNAGTMWHTQWQGASPPHPHTFTVNLGTAQAVGGFTYLPRLGGGKGGIADWEFWTSANGVDWTKRAGGTWPYTQEQKTELFGVAAPKPLPNADTLFGDMVGLGVKFQQGQPLSELPTLVDLGVRWIRSDIWFSDFNTVTGQFAANTTLQTMAAFCAANNIGIVALLQMGSYDPVVFARFAVEVAKYLKTTGARFVLELGNEPHNSSIVAQFGGSWQGAGPAPWLVQYVKIVNEAVTALMALDPAIKTLSDDDMWVVSYWMLDAGLSTGITGMAFHPYSGGADRPEQTAVAWNTDWCAPYQVVDQDGSFVSAVRRLRNQAITKLAKPIEMWATEMGFTQAGGAAREMLVAAYLPRAMILASESGVDVMCWFSAQDGPDGSMGLKDNALRPRPAYAAMKTMTQQLGNYKRAVRIAGKQALVGTQAFALSGPTGRKIVAWTADGGAVIVPSVPGSSAVSDMLGGVIQNNPAMKLSGAPLYVTTQATDAQLAAWAAAL